MKGKMVNLVTLHHLNNVIYTFKSMQLTMHLPFLRKIEGTKGLLKFCECECGRVGFRSGIVLIRVLTKHAGYLMCHVVLGDVKEYNKQIVKSDYLIDPLLNYFGSKKSVESYI